MEAICLQGARITPLACRQNNRLRIVHGAQGGGLHRLPDTKYATESYLKCIATTF